MQQTAATWHEMEEKWGTYRNMEESTNNEGKWRNMDQTWSSMIKVVSVHLPGRLLVTSCVLESVFVHIFESFFESSCFSLSILSIRILGHVFIFESCYESVFSFFFKHPTLSGLNPCFKQTVAPNYLATTPFTFRSEQVHHLAQAVVKQPAGLEIKRVKRKWTLRLMPTNWSVWTCVCYAHLQALILCLTYVVILN